MAASRRTLVGRVGRRLPRRLPAQDAQRQLRPALQHGLARCSAARVVELLRAGCRAADTTRLQQLVAAGGLAETCRSGSGLERARRPARAEQAGGGLQRRGPSALHLQPRLAIGLPAEEQRLAEDLRHGGRRQAPRPFPAAGRSSEHADQSAAAASRRRPGRAGSKANLHDPAVRRAGPPAAAPRRGPARSGAARSTASPSGSSMSIMARASASTASSSGTARAAYFRQASMAPWIVGQPAAERWPGCCQTAGDVGHVGGQGGQPLGRILPAGRPQRAQSPRRSGPSTARPSGRHGQRRLALHHQGNLRRAVPGPSAAPAAADRRAEHRPAAAQVPGRQTNRLPRPARRRRCPSAS